MRSPTPQRLTAWVALSDLFLDGELDDDGYARIGRQLTDTGYEWSELKRILEQEVAPAFFPNVLNIAGEWAGWSEAEVAEIVTRSLRRPRILRPGEWIRALFFRRYTETEWRKVIARAPRGGNTERMAEEGVL